jgi:SAM-dependent methyltransferase
MEAQDQAFKGETAIPLSRQGKCPVCSSTDVNLRAGGGLPTTERTRSFLFRQNAYEIIECNACGFVFKDSILDGGQFAALYGDTDYARWESETLYPTERCVVDILRGLKPGSRILDFGCSSGRLMARLVDQHACFGFEINQQAAQKAAAKGLRMIGSTEGLVGYTGTMDAVVLMDVFEHLESPLPVLKMLVPLLASDGALILVTGDADCTAGRPDLANFWYFRSIQHLGMLSRVHAEYLARELSMRFDSWKTISHYDIPMPQKLLQYSRQFVFRQIKEHPDSIMTALLKKLPVVNRCAAWNIPPPFNASDDHAVVVLRRHADPSKGAVATTLK